MTNTLSPERVSILQWSILYDKTAAKLFLYFSHYFIHSPFSFSWHKLLKCGSLSVTLFWSLISATFGRFCAFFQLPKVAVKERRRKSNIFIGTQDFLTTLKQHSQSHTPIIATQRAEERDGLLTVLVDFPAEVLLFWGVCRARQQEVRSGLGPGLLTVVVVVEEWVRAQRILVAVALVAVKARSWKNEIRICSHSI